MNPNKFHDKILVLLTVTTKELWMMTLPAFIVLAILLGLHFSPAPSMFSLTSIVTSIIAICLFNVYLMKNRIEFNERAIYEAEVEEFVAEEEKPLDDHIESEDTEEEETQEEKEVPLTSNLDFIELDDYEDEFDFGTSIRDTYMNGSNSEMANVAVNSTKNKAESMLK